MPIRCAWCGKQVGEDAGLSRESHGICPECAKANFPEAEEAAGAMKGSPGRRDGA